MFYCKIRPYETERKYNLDRHVLSCQIQCSECREAFPQKQQLDKHIRKEHGNITCSICGKEFGNNRNLAKHQKNQHNLTKTKETLTTSIGFMKVNEDSVKTDTKKIF